MLALSSSNPWPHPLKSQSVLSVSARPDPEIVRGYYFGRFINNYISTNIVLFSTSKEVKEVTSRHELHDNAYGISINADAQYFHYVGIVQVPVHTGRGIDEPALKSSPLTSLVLLH